MDLNILSYNVHGLNSRRAQTRLKIFLSELRCNVVFIQEHKLIVVNDRLLSTQIWEDKVFYATPAVDGVHAFRNPIVQASKGGIAIGVSKEIADLVSNVTISPCGRAILLYVNDPLGGPFGLLNIYGPNTIAERTTLWEYFATTMDTTRPWLVGGDFNMTVNASNQRGLAWELAGAEYVAWTDFVYIINLIDAYTRSGNLVSYTWDNNRVDSDTATESARVLKRLDRFYLSVDLCNMFPVAHTMVLPKQTMSDHLTI